MTKKLMALLLVMLALTGCKESKDEPTPGDKVDGDVYVLVGSYDRDFVYNLDGETIYSSPEGSHIASLQAEGGDWYALVKYILVMRSERIRSRKSSADKRI